MTHRLLALGLLLGCTVGAVPAAARDYGQQGAFWPVIEPDLLRQIHARLQHLEATGETARLNEELKRRTITRVNRPEPVAGVSLAADTRVWRFDPTITVERDIADDKGRTIIAAGTRVNPLDTVPLRAPLVLLDGDDPAHARPLCAAAANRTSRPGAEALNALAAPSPRRRRLAADVPSPARGDCPVDDRPTETAGTSSRRRRY